jgi:chemotaxis response regulator CheB
MKRKAQVTVLIVSQPGVLQNILIDSLQELPVEVAGVASGGLSAVAMLKGRLPDMLILDANLPIEETLALLEHVRGKYPQVYCLVISETSRARTSMRAAGAHFVALSFNLSRELPGVIAEVQARPGVKPGYLE